MIARIVILLPLLAAVLGLAVRRNDIAARVVAIGSSAMLLVAGLVGMLAADPGVEVIPTVGSLSLPGIDLPLVLLSTPTLATVAAIVTLVACAVQVYAAWYLETDDRYPVFAATVSLFSAAMLLLVHSGDLALTVIGWEVMGWCSYLLIGHWSRTQSARRAAMKALLVTRVADIGFVLGIIGLAVGAQSTGLQSVLGAWTDQQVCIDARLADGASLAAATQACAAPSPAIRSLLIGLIVIGVMGKSALIPFQDWLPDAMAGPTPASALIHAATMVAAGTVVLAVLLPVLAEAEPARWLLGLSAAATMVFAALMAFAQSDLKRLLAWSTVSQVAVMLGALASVPATVGPGAGLFHLVSHAIFKALLFLVIGWLAVTAGGTAVEELRGSARASLLAQIALGVGLASLAGVPVLVGGVSKEQVLDADYAGAVAPGGPGLVVLIATLLSVVLTAAYATRALIIATTHVPGRAAHRPALTWSVAGVLTVLTVGALTGGLLSRSAAFALPSASWVWLIISALLLSVGVAIAWRAGTRGDPAQVLARRFIPYADAGLGVDRLYVSLVARPVLLAGRVARFLDTEVIDGYVRATAVTARFTGMAAARAHRGERPSTSVVLVVLGALALALWGVLSWT